MDNNIKKNLSKMNGKNIKQHSRNENKPEKDSVPVQFVSRDPK
jgi:hypothetical protein